MLDANGMAAAETVATLASLRDSLSTLEKMSQSAPGPRSSKNTDRFGRLVRGDVQLKHDGYAGGYWDFGRGRGHGVGVAEVDQILK